MLPGIGARPPTKPSTVKLGNNLCKDLTAKRGIPLEQVGNYDTRNCPPFALQENTALDSMPGAKLPSLDRSTTVLATPLPPLRRSANPAPITDPTRRLNEHATATTRSARLGTWTRQRPRRMRVGYRVAPSGLVVASARTENLIRLSMVVTMPKAAMINAEDERIAAVSAKSQTSLFRSRPACA